MEKESETPQLKRRVSLFAVTMYGVGNILGAGIYALIGEVVGITGNLSWLSFVLASITGALTGLSYAELSAMYPKSAAEFVYAEKAFNKRGLSFILGWIIIFSGLFSSATVALGFAKYLAALISIDSTFLIVLFAIILVGILGMINFAGIKSSTWTNILFTLIEAAGLIFIIIIGIPYFGSVNYIELPVGATFTAVFSSIALIFFAYIGFEDIANIAEEVKKPEKNLPKAIIYSLIITTILYLLTAIAVVSILPYSEIAASPDPLSAVTTAALGPVGGLIMSLIALFATANTVLIMLIVTSRMMYGMARDKALPKSLCKVSEKHRTPIISVFLTMILTMVFTLFTDISIVANATVFGVLINFLIVNICVIVLRKKNPDDKRPFKLRPNIGWVPVVALIGAIVCIGLLFTFDLLTILIQGIVILIGLLIFYIPKILLFMKRSIRNRLQRNK